MGMTIVEKILSEHVSQSPNKVKAGDLIEIRVDIALGNDITAPLAIVEFEKLGIDKLFDPDRLVLVLDHFVPCKDIKSAEQCKFVRDFARKHQLKNYFELKGIEHTLLPDEGLVLPGDVIIGADSHTCTYGALGAMSTGVGSTDLAAVMATGEIWFKVPETIKFIYNGSLQKWVGGKDIILHTIGDIGVDGANYMAMEFTGDVISSLPMADRFTMSNMAIEAGGKCGIIPPDEITIEYVKNKATRGREWKIYSSDNDAIYKHIKEYDCSKLEPQVAFPHLPSNVQPITRVGNVKIDQGVIGSCTNGRIEDLRIAADVLKGHKIHKNIRLIIIPGTQQIYLEAVKEGIVEIFIESGACVSVPTCGPCLGGHMGILAKGERAIATTNRNFVGRMGHKESEVYLANPAIVAASTILGRIGSPEEI